MVVFDHAGLESLDIEADVALHTGALGMRLIRWGVHAMTGGRMAMLIDSRGVKVELIEVAEITGALAHTAFQVADLAEALAGAEAAGATTVDTPFRIDAARADSCSVAAPGGAPIQLIHYRSDSPDLPG
jgi:4-hydroxyphenylpyruvate dioxygenase-like putative hemolysin